MAYTFNEEEIRKAIAVFHPEGRDFEVRFVKGKWNMAGIFNSADSLIRAMSNPRIRPDANAYMTLNRVHEACYAGRDHRDQFIEYFAPTVSDNDVIGYDWLLVDVDPKRPAPAKLRSGSCSSSAIVAGMTQLSATAETAPIWFTRSGWRTRRSGNSCFRRFCKR